MNSPSDKLGPAHALERIARHLASEHVDRGLLAALRRFHPTTHGRHCVFETQQMLGLAGLEPNDDESWRRWAVVVHCLALVRGAVGRRSAGEALASMRFSELRLKQVLEADAALLDDLLPLVARRLAANGVAVDWWPLAKLLLHAGRDEVRADEARSLLARDYLYGQRRITPAAPAAQPSLSETRP